MKALYFLRGSFVALVSIICSVAVQAQLKVPYVNASFTFDSRTEQIVKNDIADTDNVEIIVDGHWDASSGYYMIPTSATLTFKAEDFQNICYLRLFTYHYDDTDDYPVTCSIVNVKGRGIDGIDDLKTGFPPKTTRGTTSQGEVSDIYTFNFGDETELSEITLKFSADLYIDRASLSLNVDPIIEAEEIRIYAKDIVPFEKQTNLPVYQYYISTNQDLDEDELTDKFQNVPDKGITLEGKSDGQYAVYLRTNPDITTNHPIHKVIVNYLITPPSTQIESTESITITEYYDLNGRRINTPSHGLNIVKNPTTGKASKIVSRPH